LNGTVLPIFFTSFPALCASGVEAVNCESVTISGSSISATLNSYYCYSSGAPLSGFDAIDSNVQVFDSAIVSGPSDAGSLSVFGPDAQSPGPGVSISGGSILAAGSTFRGGEGCDGVYMEQQVLGYLHCREPGTGGNGLELNGAMDEPARLLDVQLDPGDPGPGPGPCGDSGTGVALLDNGFPSILLPFTSGRISLDCPVRSGQMVSVEIEGAPGDFVFLFIGLTTDSTLIPSWNGFAFVQAQFVRTLGFINQSEVKTIGGTASVSAPGAGPTTFYLQTLRFSQAQDLVIDHPVSAVIIGASLSTDKHNEHWHPAPFRLCWFRDSHSRGFGVEPDSE
jgi:hypothetical protein